MTQDQMLARMLAEHGHDPDVRAVVVDVLAHRTLPATDVLDVQRIADLCASHAMARLRAELAEQMRATGYACQIALADALERG